MPALSWCSAGSSVCESVFLMYPLREMRSTSTYSSAILFSLINVCGLSDLESISIAEKPGRKVHGEESILSYMFIEVK